MRRIKNGFTLMEVLLALAIVGVIAALTIPQIVQTTQKDQAGAVLGKVVEQFELGCQNMIQDYNSSDDAGTSKADTLMAMDGDFVFSIAALAPYIGATENRRALPNRPGMVVQPRQFQQYKFTKLPAEMNLLPLNPLDAIDADDVVYDTVIIDVNGTDKAPNRDGKDLFTFELRNNGKLIPRGLNTWQNTCPENGNITNPVDCTARVVRDGFKIKYNL